MIEAYGAEKGSLSNEIRAQLNEAAFLSLDDPALEVRKAALRFLPFSGYNYDKSLRKRVEGKVRASVVAERAELLADKSRLPSLLPTYVQKITRDTDDELFLSLRNEFPDLELERALIGKEYFGTNEVELLIDYYKRNVGSVLAQDPAHLTRLSQAARHDKIIEIFREGIAGAADPAAKFEGLLAYGKWAAILNSDGRDYDGKLQKLMHAFLTDWNAHMEKFGLETADFLRMVAALEGAKGSYVGLDEQMIPEKIARLLLHEDAAIRNAAIRFKHVFYRPHLASAWTPSHLPTDKYAAALAARQYDKFFAVVADLGDPRGSRIGGNDPYSYARYEQGHALREIFAKNTISDPAFHRALLAHLDIPRESLHGAAVAVFHAARASLLTQEEFWVKAARESTDKNFQAGVFRALTENRPETPLKSGPLRDWEEAVAREQAAERAALAPAKPLADPAKVVAPTAPSDSERRGIAGAAAKILKECRDRFARMWRAPAAASGSTRP